jgi:hypothetical protein
VAVRMVQRAHDVRQLRQNFISAMSWAAQMMFLVNVFNMTASQDPGLKTSLLALAYSWNSAFSPMYAIEFMCLSAAKLMVLDRISFAAQQGTRLQKQWSAAGRVVVSAVVLGNAVGLQHLFVLHNASSQ